MTRQVQLSDRAYRILAAQKRPGESFSETVTRLAGKEKDPWRFVGRRSSGLGREHRMRLAEDAKGPEL